VVQNLSENSDELPENAAQAAALADLPPSEQGEVWQEAVKTAPTDLKSGKRKVTEKHVKDTKKKMGKGKKKAQAQQKEETTKLEPKPQPTGSTENATQVEFGRLAKDFETTALTEGPKLLTSGSYH
jgi:sRNA-binding protein